MRLLRRLRYLLRHRREAREVREEIELHRAMVEDARRAEGWTEEEARIAARREMGNATQASEDARRVWVWGWAESVGQDLRYAARSLAARPGFTGIALVALAIGIGMNIAGFTFFNALLLRPFQAPDAERVVAYRDTVGWLSEEARATLGASRTLSETALSHFGVANSVRSGSDANGAMFLFRVSAGYFRLLGVEFAVGRGFLPEEDTPSAAGNVMVLMHRTWQRRYASDPAIVGRTVYLNDVPFTVVGVASETFVGFVPEFFDGFVPFPALGGAPGGMLIGRLAPGATTAQAEAELRTLRSQFRPEPQPGEAPLRLTGTRLIDLSPPPAEAMFGIGMVGAAVGSILILACANVGNLLLARASARRREIAIRVFIGASRVRIVRQLLTESLLLSSVAAGVGVALASILPHVALSRIADPYVNAFLAGRMSMDGSILGFSIAAGAVSALLFGLVPALRTARGADLSTRSRFRGALLGIQVAVSTVLLMVAAVVGNGLRRSMDFNPGFPADAMSNVRIDSVADTSLEGLIGVLEPQLVAVNAGLTSRAPWSGERRPFRLDGGGAEHYADIAAVDAGFFTALQMPLVAGRSFTPADRNQNNAVVNEAFAREYWPTGDALGRTILLSRGEDQPIRVVGIVRDGRVFRPGVTGPAIFLDIRAEAGRTDAGLSAFSVIAPNKAVSAVLEAIERADPGVRATRTPLTEPLAGMLAANRLTWEFTATLGAVALVLAAIGVYGVFSYSVEQRRKEIGIRMALGAHPAQLVRLIVRQNGWAVTAGLAAGGVAGVGIAYLLRSELYGVEPFDPAAFTAVLAVLSAAGVAASAIPARRAARTNPVTALHHE